MTEPRYTHFFTVQDDQFKTAIDLIADLFGLNSPNLKVGSVFSGHPFLAFMKNNGLLSKSNSKIIEKAKQKYSEPEEETRSKWMSRLILLVGVLLILGFLIALIGNLKRKQNPLSPLRLCVSAG